MKQSLKENLFQFDSKNGRKKRQLYGKEKGYFELS